MKPVRFLLPAERELAEAAQFYNRQALGLGDDFLDKITSAVQDIAKAPRRWPILGSSYIRRRLVHRFPYGLLYRIDPDEIVILAVMHLNRRPNYWMSRL